MSRSLSPILVTYRAFLRFCAKVKEADLKIRLSPPMETAKQRYSVGRFIYQNEDTATVLQQALLPGVDFAGAGYAGCRVFDGDDIRKIVRREYRRPVEASVGSSGNNTSSGATQSGSRPILHVDGMPSGMTTADLFNPTQDARNFRMRFGLDSEADGEDGAADYSLSAPTTPLDAAFQHLSTLNRLRIEAQQTTVTQTIFSGMAKVTIVVEITTHALEHTPEAHAFIYRIRIRNIGQVVSGCQVNLLGPHEVLIPCLQAAQLLSRHWVFEDAAGGQITVPKGSRGVVGQTPVLQPEGQTFEYVSGTQLQTPTGLMSGSFQMFIPATKERFEAEVSATPLR